MVASALMKVAAYNKRYWDAKFWLKNSISYHSGCFILFKDLVSRRICVNTQDKATSRGYYQMGNLVAIPWKLWCVGLSKHCFSPTMTLLLEHKGYLHIWFPFGQIFKRTSKGYKVRQSAVPWVSSTYCINWVFLFGRLKGFGGFR